MNITYWSDYACPYCYIGETRLKKAIAQMSDPEDFSLEMKSFELDPDAPAVCEGDTVTRFAKKYRISPMLAAHQIERISQMGRDEGLAFQYALSRSTNTMDAHRLTKLAVSKGDPDLTDRLIERLFDAYFGQNLELADHDTLRKIAEECGLDPSEVDDVLSSDRFRRDVLEDEAEAERRGIRGVPFFVIDGKYEISGAQSVPAMRSALLRALAETEAPSDPAGMVCGPDGCR